MRVSQLSQLSRLFQNPSSRIQSTKPKKSDDFDILILAFVGVSKQLTAIILAVAGGLEIIFRAGNGYLADQHVVTAYTQFLVSMLITGTSILICAIFPGLVGT